MDLGGISIVNEKEFTNICLKVCQLHFPGLAQKETAEVMLTARIIGMLVSPEQFKKHPIPQLQTLFDDYYSLLYSYSEAKKGRVISNDDFGHLLIEFLTKGVFERFVEADYTLSQHKDAYYKEANQLVNQLQRRTQKFHN